MRKNTNRLLIILLTITMIFTGSIFVNADDLAESYEGKTVILSSNDVHGAVDGYAYMAALEKKFESLGADVVMVDSGDFAQGTAYVSESRGASAIELMNMTGYDYATVGNHEFDFGINALNTNIAEAKFKFLCADIIYRDNGELVYTPSDIYVDEDSGLKIGFFGMTTPETQTKSMPSNFKDMTFPSRDELYPLAQNVIDELRNDGADIVVCLAHLGVDEESEPYRSYDLLANTDGIDIVLDAHSHSIMTYGDNSEPIMSAGTKFECIGVTVIDEGSKTIDTNFLYHLKDKSEGDYTTDLTPDPDVKAASDTLIAKIDTVYKTKIGETRVKLNGAKGYEDGLYGNRDGETNLGDLVADAIKWYAIKDGADVSVPYSNVVSITNGGGIRASVEPGDITKNDIRTVLPFPNTICAVIVTGRELLEALEASTFCSPNSQIGGFPQISGMKITIRAYKAYDPMPEHYPNSTYYGPASINRITIDEVNGKPFDINGVYAVLTSDFMANGGDTYYAFASSSSQFDTGMLIDYAVSHYIIDQLDGVVDESYAAPQGRISYQPSPEEIEKAISELPHDITEADREAVENARKYYDKMTGEELAELSAGTLEKLEAAEAKLDALDAHAAQDAAETKTAAVAKLAADLVEAATGGFTASKYTASSFKGYNAAVKAATEILKNAGSASTEEINNADSKLLAAKKALVRKAKQPMKASGKTVSFKAKSLKKKSATLTAKKAFTISKNKGKVTFKKTSGSSKIKVSSSGKVTIKKGLKKGTYTVKVKVTAAGDGKYLVGSKTATLTIKVR